MSGIIEILLAVIGFITLCLVVFIGGVAAGIYKAVEALTQDDKDEMLVLLEQIKQYKKRV